jgi:DNA-directed RNA polymerase specialized sigma24 family protein
MHKTALHQVRELIRRAKAWRNVTWGDNKVGKPKSYLISLLVITAYDRVKNKHRKMKLLAQE